LKKFLLLLVLTLCLLTPGALAQEDGSDVIQLRGYSETDGYQYVQIGYYPYYSDGTLAPVLWRVLDVQQNSVLLQSVYALDAYYGNKYSDPFSIYSDFDSFFTHTSQFERRVILIDSTLSAADLCSEEYGFSAETGNHRSRSVKPTPFAAAKGLPTEDEYVSYWTYEGNSVRRVTPAGSILPVNYASTLAVVPTISIGVDELHMDKGSGTMDDPYASTASEISMWMEKNMFFDLQGGETVTIKNYNRRKLLTYSGPGVQYYRQPNSQINVRTAAVKLLAREGRWVLIEYKTGGGNARRLPKTAWIHEGDLGTSQGMKQAVARADSLPEFNISGTMAEQTELYDDVDMVRDPLYTLWEGQEIDFLGYTYINHMSMAYIETEIYNKPVRGYVPIASIELDEYEIDNLLTMIGE